MPDEEWDRMLALFNGKLELEKHAFGSEALRLKRENKKITMEGLTRTYGEYSLAACQYLARLAVLAHETKRVNHTKGTSPRNEKYAFRTWLLRLGFIGDEYKDSRALLLKNLPGSAARKEERQ